MTMSGRKSKPLIPGAMFAAETEAEPDDICQCPRCGRMHRHLGTPPSDWRPIESCPKDGSRFLVTTTQGLVQEAYYLDNSLTPRPWKGVKPTSQYVAVNLFKPTHWQPLPAPAVP